QYDLPLSLILLNLACYANVLFQQSYFGWAKFLNEFLTIAFENHRKEVVIRIGLITIQKCCLAPCVGRRSNQSADRRLLSYMPLRFITTQRCRVSHAHPGHEG